MRTGPSSGFTDKKDILTTDPGIGTSQVSVWISESLIKTYIFFFSLVIKALIRLLSGIITLQVIFC